MKYKLAILLILAMLMNNSVVNFSSADDIDVPYAYLYYSDFSGILQDGAVGENEYPSSLELTDLAGDFVTKIWWAHNGTTIAVALMAPGTGWIGLGLGELGTTMIGGNLIMASYDPVTDAVAISDMFANTQTDPIVDDNAFNFTSTGGSEVNGETIIEFTIPMASDDPAGHDHFWDQVGRFGFFTAFRTSGKEFDKEHHKHSESETVEVLDPSHGPPVESDFQFSVVNNNDGTVKLSSTFSAGSQSEAHEVGYFQKTIFGEVFLKDVFTDSNGLADFELAIEKTGEITFVAIFFGDINHTRKELTSTINIEEIIIDEETEFGDLRDTLGPHFMRGLLVFMLFFFVSWLIYLYSATVYDLFRINKIGRNVVSSKMEEKKE